MPWLNSVPQCRFTITAPPRLLRARLAAFRILRAPAQLKLQAWGTLWPLETAVKERKATRIPLALNTVVLVASVGERAVPACLMPARSSARSVVSIPYWPASSEWFDAVLQASQPVALTARASAGGVRKLG